MPKRLKVDQWDRFWKLTIIRELDKHIYPSWKTRRIFKCICDCWTFKETTLNHLRSWATKSCGCIHTDYLKIRVGEQHPNYKWWMELKSKIRSSDLYKKWRSECYERDNYTCQISWQKWWDLVVHHLNPFALLVDEYWEDNLVLFDLNNWITITKELHNQFHKQYWQTWFTKEDFLEFKEVIVGSLGV